MFMNYQLIFLTKLVFLNEILRVISDCGFPALPVHMKLSPFTDIYFEDDVVQYYCEYSDMILIGNKRRVCSKSQWTGDLPHCVREIPRRYVDRIEMVNIKNHSIAQNFNFRQMYYNRQTYLRDYQNYKRMTYFGSFQQSSTQCIRTVTKSNITSNQWRIVFKWPVTQVYSVQIVIYNKSPDTRIDFNKTESVIESVFVGPNRDCQSEPVEILDLAKSLFKYKFKCELKSLDISQNTEAMRDLRRELLNNITISFATNEPLVICELHIGETLPFRSFSAGSCGSPDVPLFSNYTPIFDAIMGSPVPVGYSFRCDDGFHLDGNPAVMCGINNKWMDPFPKCVPDKTCQLLNNTRLSQLNLAVNYQNLYSFDGNISAIHLTKAIYSCAQNKKEDNQDFNETLFGDSVRLCDMDGNWTGEEPVCLDKNDFTLYLAELNEDILKDDSHSPKFAQHQHRPDECHIPAIPKYAKVYTYDPNLLNIYLANVKERLDLMPTYPNGSVITYSCDSKFSYMASDFESRTCVNGSWIGHIGKCYTPVGGTDTSRALSIQERRTNGTTNVSNRVNVRVLAQNKSDKFWNYMENDNNKCQTFDIEPGVKLSLTIYLSMPVRVSYYMIRLGARYIFNELEDSVFKIHRASQLTRLSPLSSDINLYFYNKKTECEVTKVIETGTFDKFDGITLVSFKCDEPYIQNSNQMGAVYAQHEDMKTNAISLHIDPDRFHHKFNSTNITFCGLIIFESSEDCGIPEVIPNAEIISSQSSYVRYRCKPGYKLVGNEYVRCSKFGDWMDQFPKCQLYKLCDIKENSTNSTELLIRQYFNTLVIDGKETAVFGSIVKFKCRSENILEGLHIMIGPRTAICTQSGKWSVDEPICADDMYLIREQMKSSDNKPYHKVIQLIIFIIISIVLILIALIFMNRRYGCSDHLAPLFCRKKLNRNSSTFISYEQANIRNSIMSFNSGVMSINNPTSLA